MKTKDLLIVMGTLGSTFVLLYGWPTMHRFDHTVDGRLVRISRVTQETRVLEEGRGWVKTSQANPPRALFCPGTCPDKASTNKSWRPQARIVQPKDWTLSSRQQKKRPKQTNEKMLSHGLLKSSAAELNLGGSSQCSCQNTGTLWQMINKFIH